MKNKMEQFVLIMLVFIFIFVPTVKAIDYDIEIRETEYTEEYKKWLELSEDEKSKILEPRKYDIESKSSTNDNLLKNKNITLKNMFSLLRSNANYTDNTFNLKDLIANNMIIKDQQNTNTCWTFASISSLETNLALKNYYSNIAERLYDYSERHMAYSSSQSFFNGSVNKYGKTTEVKDGGTCLMAQSYLTNGNGAILESDMPFENNEDKIDISTIQNKTVQTTVEDTVMFDMISNTDMSKFNSDSTIVDRVQNLKEQIKKHIISYGSVYTAIYMPGITGDDYLNYSNSSIYCNHVPTSDLDEIKTNHAVSIVGWQDNYSKDNFKNKPINDGAWIIRNSYGEEREYGTFDEVKQEIVDSNKSDNLNSISDITDEALINYIQENTILTVDEENKKIMLDIGENGYFYISYEDYNVYSQLWGIVNSEDSKTYDKIYQHDELGYTEAWYLTGNGDTYIKNVFTRENSNDEYITSIGFTTIQEGTYEVYINKDGIETTSDRLIKRELIEGENISLSAGYHTLKLKNPIKITGKSFSIVIKIKDIAEKEEYFCVENNDDDNNATSLIGESFVSKGNSIDSLEWYDIGNINDTQWYMGNLCIKAMVSNNVEENPEEDPEEDSEEDPKEDPEENPEKDPEEDPKEEIDKPSASDFSKANSNMSLKSFSFSTEKDTINIEVELKIENIKVEKLSDEYTYYYHLSNINTEKNILETEWKKTNSKIVLNRDGTYSLSIIINNYDELESLSEEEEIYVYIKEISKKGSNILTSISNPIDVEIKTSDIDDSDVINKQNENISNNGDSTIAQTSLPKTGIKYLTIILILISLSSIILFIRYRKLKDIK